MGRAGPEGDPGALEPQAAELRRVPPGCQRGRRPEKGGAPRRRGDRTERDLVERLGRRGQGDRVGWARTRRMARGRSARPRRPGLTEARPGAAPCGSPARPTGSAAVAGAAGTGRPQPTGRSSVARAAVGPRSPRRSVVRQLLRLWARPTLPRARSRRQTGPRRQVGKRDTVERSRDTLGSAVAAASKCRLREADPPDEHVATRGSARTRLPEDSPPWLPPRCDHGFRS
jgi:hypothetical protein